MLTQITGVKLEGIKKLLLAQIAINPIVAAMVKKVTPVSDLKIIRKTELKSYLYYIGKSTDTDAAVLKTRPLRFVKTQIDALEAQLSESLPATSTARHAFVLTEHVKKQAGGTPLSLTEDDKLFIVSAGGDNKHRRFLLRNHRNATVSDVVDSIEKRLTTTSVNVATVAPSNIVIPLGTAQEIKVALAELIDPEGEVLFPEDIHLSETHFKLGHGYKATLLNTSLVLFGSIEFKIGEPGETEEPETIDPLYLSTATITDVKFLTNQATLKLPSAIPPGYVVAIQADGYKPQNGDVTTPITTLMEYITQYGQSRHGGIVVSSNDVYENGGYNINLMDAVQKFLSLYTEKFSIYFQIHLFNAAGNLVSSKPIIDAAPLFAPAGADNDYPPAYLQTITDDEKQVSIKIADLQLAANDSLIGASVSGSYGGGEANNYNNAIFYNAANNIDELKLAKFNISTLNGRINYIHINDFSVLPEGDVFTVENTKTLSTAADINAEEEYQGTSTSGNYNNFNLQGTSSAAVAEAALETVYPDDLLWEPARDGLTTMVTNLTSKLIDFKLIDNQTNQPVLWFYLAPPPLE